MAYQSKKKLITELSVTYEMKRQLPVLFNQLTFSLYTVEKNSCNKTIKQVSQFKSYKRLTL